MPINIPRELPAFETLAGENIFVMESEKAIRQDIRPLRAAIFNLMPTKIETETQLLRLLSNTPIQVDITLLRTATHIPKHTAPEHLAMFYKTLDEIWDEYFDALIITGAPVERYDFEQVSYWAELCKIMEWSRSHAFSTMHICWGAFAGLYYHYGIPKYNLSEKMFGVFPHRVTAVNHPLLKGFDDIFYAPHSRFSEVRREDILANPGLTLLAESDQAGVYIVSDRTNRQIFITGHGEYDLGTLKNEYQRDLAKGESDVPLPYGYFPDDNPSREPKFTWRAAASLMYSNWLNFCIYQETPFDIHAICPLER
ncbi:MAG: homoserine O-succinyltransferase [Bacteroides sp.]|nr:homoserine O-succinyltransferase [Eubacterium sp.]MCM1418805.1 homoserine O-succinyltransferase [Roseburia sp.]MCM1462078.1 homoserine O-succinyltransferase [Bacteroides sp.]